MIVTVAGNAIVPVSVPLVALGQRMLPETETVTLAVGLSVIACVVLLQPLPAIDAPLTVIVHSGVVQPPTFMTKLTGDSVTVVVLVAVKVQGDDDVAQLDPAIVLLQALHVGGAFLPVASVVTAMAPLATMFPPIVQLTEMPPTDSVLTPENGPVTVL